MTWLGFLAIAERALRRYANADELPAQASLKALFQLQHCQSELLPGPGHPALEVLRTAAIQPTAAWCMMIRWFQPPYALVGPPVLGTAESMVPAHVFGGMHEAW
jgi:hypothetical protein